MRLLIVLCSIFIANVYAQSLDAHVHGIASMDIAIIDKDLQIDIDSPAYNFLGFEHEPENKKEEAIYKKSLSTLEKIDFGIKNAKCKIKNIEVHSALEDEDHDKHDEHGDEEKHEEHGHDDDHEEHGHDEDHDDHEEEGHFEIQAHYSYICKNVQDIALIDMKELFTKFNSLEKIEVQWINNKKQGSASLNNKKTKVVF